MLRTLLTGCAMVLLASPAFADTINCESPGELARIDIEVEFDSERQAGTITAVGASTEYTMLSTQPGGNAEGPEVMAVQNVAYDRIEVGLETPGVGPMTLTLDIVRAASYLPGDDKETDVVVAGVANVASIGTVSLLCTGW